MPARVAFLYLQPRQNKSRHQQLENGLGNGPVDISQLMQYSKPGRDGIHDIRPHQDIRVNTYSDFRDLERQLSELLGGVMY